MLENRSCESCLVFASSCQQETTWSYMYNGKRPVPNEFSDSDGSCRETKLSKISSSDEDDSSSDDNNNNNHNNSNISSNSSSPQDSRDHHHHHHHHSRDQSDEEEEEEEEDSKQADSASDLDSSLNNHRSIGVDKRDLNNQSEDDSLSDSVEEDSPEEEQSDEEEDGDRRHAGDSSSDLDALIQPIGRDNSISCLIRCSRSDYGSIASLNRSFRSLIRSGEIYKLRRQNDVVEHWVYFSCHLLQWEAFDPIRHRWMHLPPMPHNECFIYSDKESLAVGTELLVFGKEVNSQVIYRYSILTNSWTFGTSMNAPRCLFGSASLGEIAILAGGCDSQGNILSSAEMYNSETQKWETLPSMNKARKMCSGVFMDKKFYVIGGVGSDARVFTCGEEYDIETRKWTEIPNMSPGRSGAAGEAEIPATAGAPPLVAVVNDELYAADYADMEVKKYDKERRAWFTVGRLPERAVSMNGWGLAFRACGDRLIVIGGPRALGEGFIELNSWVPSEGPPQWNLLDRRQLGNFVYNCAVMGC